MDYDPQQLKRELTALHTRRLADGRIFMTDGTTGIAKYEGIIQGSLIDVPTLHVRSPTASNRHWGMGLKDLCESSLTMEFLHDHDHDFPRGHAEMKKVTALIRETAERA
jgi:hypothetical protein